MYALICALSVATADALSKKALISNDSYLVAWVRVGYTAPLMIFIFPFINIHYFVKKLWEKIFSQRLLLSRYYFFL